MHQSSRLTITSRCRSQKRQSPEVDNSFTQPANLLFQFHRLLFGRCAVSGIGIFDGGPVGKVEQALEVSRANPKFVSEEGFANVVPPLTKVVTTQRHSSTSAKRSIAGKAIWHNATVIVVVHAAQHEVCGDTTQVFRDREKRTVTNCASGPSIKRPLERRNGGEVQILDVNSEALER